MLIPMRITGAQQEVRSGKAEAQGRREQRNGAPFFGVLVDVESEKEPLHFVPRT